MKHKIIIIPSNSYGTIKTLKTYNVMFHSEYEIKANNEEEALKTAEVNFQFDSTINECVSDIMSVKVEIKEENEVE